MTLKDAKGFEKQVGGTAAWNWPISRNGYFEDLGYHEGYHIVRYYKNVDTKYTLETEYCVNDKDGRVVAIFIEGRERIYYKRYDCCQNRETSEKLFREEVFSIMDSLCGPRCSKRGDCYWFSDTMTFRYDNKNNRLLVY